MEDRDLENLENKIRETIKGCCFYYNDAELRQAAKRILAIPEIADRLKRNED